MKGRGGGRGSIERADGAERALVHEHVAQVGTCSPVVPNPIARVHPIIVAKLWARVLLHHLGVRGVMPKSDKRMTDWVGTLHTEETNGPRANEANDPFD